MSSSSLCDLINTTNAANNFSHVEDVLYTADEKQRKVVSTIESLPLLPRDSQEPDQPSNPSCHSQNLLLLKATSAATLQCLESACYMLQDLSVQTPLLVSSTNTLPSIGSVKIKNNGN